MYCLESHVMLSVYWVPTSSSPSMKLHTSMQSGCRACSKSHVRAMEAAKAMAHLDTMQGADSTSEGASQLRKSLELLPVEDVAPLPEAPTSPPQSAYSASEQPRRPPDASNAHLQAATMDRADSSPPQPRTFGPPAVQHSCHTLQKACLTN